jgi:hypothetical protein
MVRKQLLHRLPVVNWPAKGKRLLPLQGKNAIQPLPMQINLQEVAAIGQFAKNDFSEKMRLCLVRVKVPFGQK